MVGATQGHHNGMKVLHLAYMIDDGVQHLGVLQFGIKTGEKKGDIQMIGILNKFFFKRLKISVSVKCLIKRV
jgi:hypothetical protein